MQKDIKFNKPFIDLLEKKYLLQVVKNKKFTDGQFQSKCEKFIKKKIKSKSIFLTQNCSSALEIAMILINLKPNDEVIMPSYTFTSTANAVLLRGAKPVFVDINKHDMNLNVNLVEKKINNKTKAVLVVHYAGVSCDMDKFLKLKKKYGIFLIEDAAHSFLGKYKNKYLGTIGDFGAFSFHETKNLVGGQCGALSVNNYKYNDRTKIILDKGTDRSLINNKKKYYSWKGIGSEFRATELSSSLLYAQLKKNKIIMGKRRKIWNYYYEKLSKMKNKNFYFLNKNANKKSAHHVFPLIFKNIRLRDKFILYMKKNRIFCYFHYYPLHMSVFGKKYCNYKLNSTEEVYNGLVRLPLYPDLKKAEQKKIVSRIINFINS